MPKAVIDKRSLLIISYCCVVFITTFFHEWWRDEWNAVNLVVYSSDFSQLIHLIRMEGHPPLWYLLIKLCWSIYPDKWLVIVLHLGIIISAVWLLIYKINWPFYLKVLLVFNYFLVFEYAIPVRNYSILLLFASWLVVLWQHKSHFAWMLLPAAGLFYSNVYGIIFLAGWGLYLLLEVFATKKRILEFVFFTIGMLCLAFFYFLVFAPLGNKSVEQADLDLLRVIKVLPKGLAYIWNAFIPFPLLKLDFWNTNLLDGVGFQLSKSLGLQNKEVVITYFIKSVLGIPLLYLLLKPLWSNKRILLALLLSWFGMYLLQVYLYEGYLRHWGYYFITYILWLIISEQEVRILKYVLVIGVLSGIVATGFELNNPFSTAELVASDIRKANSSQKPVVMTTYREIPAITGYLHQSVYFPSNPEPVVLVNWRLDDIITNPLTVEAFCVKNGLLNKKDTMFLVVPTSNSKAFSQFFSKKHSIVLKSYPHSITSEDLSLIQISPAH